VQLFVPYSHSVLLSRAGLLRYSKVSSPIVFRATFSYLLGHIARFFSLQLHQICFEDRYLALIVVEQSVGQTAF